MTTRFCPACGQPLSENARFCKGCGAATAVKSTVGPPVHSARVTPRQYLPAPRAARAGMSFTQKIAWLFTRDGLPVLISALAGIVIGFFVSGVAGLILGTAAGLAVLWLWRRFPIRLNPWQALVIDLTPIFAKLFFALTFVLPIASYLALPSGHTPNTLPKYLSIVVAIPGNLWRRPGPDIYPGFVLIVIASIVLMYWGSTNLDKTRNQLLALGGLLLYTFSPTITSLFVGRAGVQIITDFFGAGYYFAWLGLGLLLLARFLPRLLPAEKGASPATFGLIGPALLLSALARFYAAGGPANLSFFQFFDFESSHHFIAGILSGCFAGASAGFIVDQSQRLKGAVEADEAAEEAGREGAEEEGEIGPPPEEIQFPEGPQPYDAPDVPPGSTIERLPDGRVIVRQPDGLVATRYPDGTIIANMPDGTTVTEYNDGTQYQEFPDGSKSTVYPDGTTKDWTPDGTTQTSYPDGGFEIIHPDGSKTSMTVNPDGTMDASSAYGGQMHFPKDGPPTGSLTCADGSVITMNGDGSGSIRMPNGDFVNMDKDGNMSGHLSDAEGNKVTFHPDGSVEGETAEGDKISIDANGLKATLKDGSYINMDADGNIIKAHVKDGQGTVDIHTDKKGTMHIKDDKGNTADINQDGSGQIKDSQGNVATQDSKGNATFTNTQGTTWKANNDGSGSVEDKSGNKVLVGQDGSLAVTKAGGETTRYTPEQVREMSAGADGMAGQAGGTERLTGGR